MNNKKLLAATLMATALLAGSAANAEETSVSDWAGLKAGLTTGNSTLKAIQNITGANEVVSGKTTTLNLNGMTLSGENGATSGLSFSNGQNLTLTGGGTISNFNRPDTISPESVHGDEYGAVQIGTGSTLTMTGGDWTFSGNTGGLGALNSTNGAVDATVNKIVFSNNNSSTQGGGFRHDISGHTYDSAVARITASEIEFSDNTIADTTTVGSGAGAMNSRGTMELLGDKVTFTNNSMNATVADGRKYKVGGGAVANQSGENNGVFNATMTIGKNADSVVTFSGNSSSTSGGAIMNRAVDTDGNATLTIKGNTTFSGNTAAINGGAIYNAQQAGRTATVNLNNGSYTFTGNTANKGGAIYNAGTMTIANATFGGSTEAERNSSTSRGGAIYNAGDLTLSKATFENNKSGVGGAVENALGTSSITLGNDVVFRNNEAVIDGGAIGNYSGATLVNGTIFDANRAQTGNTDTDAIGGGAMSLGAESQTKIAGATFENNTSGFNGGAIGTRNAWSANNTAAKLDVTNSKFTGNKALGTVTSTFKSGTIVSTGGNGGAIDNHFYNSDAQAGSAYVANSTFTSNKAINGGAIYNNGIEDLAGKKASMYISDSTFTDNTASTAGGAIYNGGTLTLAGTNTFSGNKANNVANDIHNVGTLNINGNTEFDSGITGDGTVILGASSVLNFIDEEVSGTSVLTAENLAITDGAKFMLDWGDTINVSNSITGDVKISDLFVEGTKLTNGGKITLFTDKVTDVDATDVVIYGAAGKYTVALGTGDDAKNLVLSQTSLGSGLAAAIDDTKAETLFSFSGATEQNIASASEEGVDVGNLNIIGDHSTASTNQINLSGGKAIAVASGHTLKVVDTKIKDANSTAIDYTINNSGTAELKNSTVDKISNAGTLTIDYENNTDIDTKLAGAGNTTLTTDNNVNWDVKNGVQQNTLTFKGSGHVTLKTTDSEHKTIVGNIINSMTGDSLEIDGAVVSGNVTNNETGHMIWTENTALTGSLTNNGLFDIKNGNNFVLNATGIAADTGKGTLNIGDDTNVAIVDAITNNAPISQNAITIASKGTLKANAGQVAVTAAGNTLTNNGTYIVGGGTSTAYATNALEVSGSGKTQVTGFVNQTAAIASTSTDADALSIASTAGLQITGGNLQANTTNDGTLNITNGTIAKAIAGAGTLKTADGVTIGGVDVTQGTLDVTGTLTNTSNNFTLTKGLTNGGTIANNGLLMLKAATATDSFTNEGTINGTGTLVIGDGTNKTLFSNLGPISNRITIMANSELDADPDQLTVTEHNLINDGALVLTAGTINFSVNNSPSVSTGHTDIVAENVSFGSPTDYAINQQINIIMGDNTPDSNSVLRAHGSNIGGNIAIDGGSGNFESTLELTGGTLSHNIYGYTKGSNTTYGDVKILGTVGDVTFASGKTADVSNLILDPGKKLINNGTISVRENLAMQPTTTDPVVLAQIENAGTLNLLGGEADDPQYIEGTILGTGNVNIGSYTDSEHYDNAYVQNKGAGSITGNITIAQGSTLKSAANKLTDTNGINNKGALNLTGSTGTETAVNMTSVITDSQSTKTGVTNIAGNVSTNGNNITQATVNIGSDGTATPVAATLTNNATIDAVINITSQGALTTATTGLVNSADITNDGTLTFNNAANGAIAQNIAGSTSTSAGVVEIAATAADKIISLAADKAITNNSIKLTSGIFDVTAKADTNGNIAATTFGSGLIANGGTLSVQDGSKTGNINLGVIDTSSSALNVAIDVNLGNATTLATSDLLSITATGSDLTNGINISNIKWVDSTTGHQAPDTIKVANDTMGNNVSIAQTEIDTVGGVGNLFLTKSYTSGEGTYLKIAHTDLVNAITSTIAEKAYTMGAGDGSIDDLTLGGNSLSITTNGLDITSTSGDKSKDGIVLTAVAPATVSDQVLSITGTVDSTTGAPNTTISGFRTAINNTKGGTVNLKNVAMTGNTTDVINDSVATDTTKGVFLSGTNNIGSIIDTDSDASAGLTTVESGTSTIGSLIQKAVTVKSPATLNIAADKLVTTSTSGTDNQGTLNLGAGNLASNITDSHAADADKTGVTNIKGAVTNTNGKTINQKSVTVASDASLTTAADKVTAVDGIDNAGTLNVSGSSGDDAPTALASAIKNATGTTNITGNVSTDKNITQAKVNVGKDSAGANFTNSGNLIADVEVTSASTLTNNTAGIIGTASGDSNYKITNSGKIINEGKIRAKGGGITNNASGATIENKNGGTISGGITNGSDSLTNVIVKNTNGTIYDGVINYGTLENAGKSDIYGGVTNYGSVTNKGSGSSNSATIWTMTNKSGATLTNDEYGIVKNLANESGGNITNKANGIVTNLNNSGDVTNGGYLTNVYNHGTIANNDGTTNGILTNTIVNYTDGKINTVASGFASTADVKNDGAINLSGDTVTGVLGAAISNGTAGTGVTNIAGTVTTNGNNITQSEVNIGKNSAGADAEATLTNDATIKANNVNITGDGVVKTAADKIIAANGIFNDGELDLNGGALASNITSSTGSTGTTNIAGNVTVASGKVIEQKTVNVGSSGLDDQGQPITAVGSLTNTGNIRADINVTTGGTLNQNDGGAIGEAIGGRVNINNAGTTNITGGDVYAETITNTAGTTTISGGLVNSKTKIANVGGTTNISSAVVTPLVEATGGMVNVNANNGQTKTSDLLGDANVSVASPAKVAVNTNTADKITVDNNVSGNGTLELKGKSGAARSSSNVGTEFNVAPNSTVSSAINLAAGQLNTGDASNITGPITVGTDATLNAQDGTYSTFANTTFANGAELKADVNAISSKSDNFTTPTENGSEYLTDLTIQDMEKIAQDSKSINLSKGMGLNKLESTDDLVANLEAKYTSVLTPIRKMNARIQTTDDGLLLNFVGTGNSYDDYNPAVFVSPVAAQLGGYLVQLNSYDQAFRNMDMYMLMTKKERQAIKFRNKMASTQNVAFDPTNTVTDSAAGWVRPYATFERVALHNGPRVSNVMYGTFLGGESELKDLGHGWDGMWGAYVGYNGSHQAYQGNGIYQNGGTLGLVGMAYKDNFFVGATINAGAGVADASTMYGSETMTMLMAGIAAKTGYNWELADGKFIIQPSLLAAYSFVNTFDYTNAAGVRMDSDPLHAITIEPGLKFIGNLKNGWQPYIGASVVINIMDRTRFMANDVSLPNLGVNPYAKYGLGVRKTWGDRFSGFLQAFFTSGGRDGVGFQGGFRWNIGKAGTGHISRDAQTPQLKQTTVSLNNKKAAK